MLRRRLIGAIPVLLGMSFLVFMLMQLAPGDPVSLLLGEEADEIDIQETSREGGLDNSILVQYWEFIKHAARGDFGDSLRYREKVSTLVLERLPATLELAIASLFVAILLSVPIGVYSAIKHLPLRLILDIASDHGHLDLEIFDLIRLDLKWVLRQDNDVGEFSDLKSTLVSFLKTRKGCSSGVHGEGLLDAQCLLRNPLLSPEHLARDAGRNVT